VRFSHWLVVTCLIAAGCGSDGRLDCHPVAGTLTLDGKPVANAEIYLVPDDERLVAAEPTIAPRGVSDAAGNFTLTTYAPNDGAPAGNYKVVAFVMGVGPGTDQEPDPTPARTKGPRPVQLPARVGDRRTTDLSAVVAPGPNTLTVTVRSK
jgi:hypothetical protein